MKIAVLIPCYNEEITIGKVVDDFKRVLPEASIYVYDNNSKDKTSEIATAHGAIVRKELRQGKGYVVRAMFRDIEADYYIMTDGDDTYPAEFAKSLLEPLVKGEANMTIGDRLSNGTYYNENKRAFHDFGNNLVRWLINKLFRSNIRDIMTGYRGMDREYVKSMPVMSKKFEIETEMTIHALDKRFVIKEIPIDYRDRPEGSESKLNTFSDGYQVLKTIIMLFKDYKPFTFFNIWVAFFIVTGLAVGIPVIIEFARTNYITKVPSAILAVGLILLGMIIFACGLILDTVVKQHKLDYELFRNMLGENRAKREAVGEGENKS
jgi:glycosyltransferase involved in cell wall biosynthesis